MLRFQAFLAAALLLFAACDQGFDGPRGGIGVQICGNGHLEGGEACDDGNAITESCPWGAEDCVVCDATCNLVAGLASRCGDGRIDPLHETCDDGNIVDETCGYGVNCAICDAACILRELPIRRCGDGIVDEDGGELCDDGPANDDRSGSCRIDCIPASCGDGILADVEECDPPGIGCRADCTLERCGDEIVDPGEACDAGPANGDLPDGCRDDCSLHRCGDGVVDSGESCDGGLLAVAHIAVHGPYGCTLLVDGSVDCWGQGLSELPAAVIAEGAVDLSVGDGFACAIRASGAIACWGRAHPELPASSSPLASPAGSFRRLAAGTAHICALDQRMQLSCWGHLRGLARPAGAYAQVVAGDGFSCVRSERATMVCWGADSLGELRRPAEAVIELAASPTHVCALREEDSFPICWGDDRKRQARDAPPQRLAAISAGRGWSCGLTPAGAMICWGERPDLVAKAERPFVRLVEGERCAIDAAGGVHCAAGTAIRTPGNRDTAGAACRADCTLPRCGDGVVDPGEGCDDGNTIDDGNGCNSTCQREGFCGDGIVQQVVEDCDDGNAITERCGHGESCSVCTASCTEGQGHTPVCGDGILDPEEGCDDGRSSGPWVMFDAGGSSACGIRIDGRIACWGGELASASVPAGRWAEVQVGSSHACARAEDGSITCFGAGEPVSPAGRFVALDVGHDLGCGIRTDGSIACWGLDGAATGSPPSGNGWRAISLAGSSGCALHEMGSLACWGPNMLAGAPRASFVSVARAPGHICAIDDAARLHCWGGSFEGEEAAFVPQGRFASVIAAGDGSCAIDRRGEAICFGGSGLSAPTGRFVALASGVAATCGIREDGRLDCFGGERLLPPGNDDQLPDACRTDCTPASCGDHTVDPGEACDDGPAPSNACSYGTVCTVCTASCTMETGLVKRCGDGVIDAAEGEVCDDGSNFVQQIGRGDDFTCALDYDHFLFCWGRNEAGQAQPPTGRFRALAVGARHACAVDIVSDEVVCWGAAGSGQLLVPAAAFGSSKLVAGNDFTCSLDPAGRLSCWGDLPFALPLLAPAADLTAGDRHLCVDLQAQGLRCFGADGAGQASPPTGYTGLTGLSAGAAHTCGLFAGAPRCWGDDRYGQSTPPANLRLLALAAGSRHTCGILADGTGGLVCWGAPPEGFGQVPPGEFVVLAASRWGHGFSCGAVREWREIQCWGSPGVSLATPPALNSDRLPDACRQNCSAAHCGDAVIDTGESCDDGNTAAGDGCSAACAIE